MNSLYPWRRSWFVIIIVIYLTLPHSIWTGGSASWLLALSCYQEFLEAYEPIVVKVNLAHHVIHILVFNIAMQRFEHISQFWSWKTATAIFIEEFESFVELINFLLGEPLSADGFLIVGSKWFFCCSWIWPLQDVLIYLLLIQNIRIEMVLLLEFVRIARLWQKWSNWLIC